MRIKATAVALAVSLALGAGAVSTPANATGIPVIDAAHIAEAIKQYEEMVKQLENMQKQLAQAKQQYESITGNRGMGNLARTDGNMISTNWKETLAQMQGGQIGQLANQIKQSASQLNNPYYVSVNGQVKKTLDGRMDDAANGAARNANVFEQTAQRQNRIVDLANRVNGASDLKAIGDLQARFQAEQSMLMNELIRLQSMNAMVENNRRVQAQAAIQGANFFGADVAKGKKQ